MNQQLSLETAILLRNFRRWRRWDQRCRKIFFHGRRPNSWRQAPRQASAEKWRRYL